MQNDTHRKASVCTVKQLILFYTCITCTCSKCKKKELKLQTKFMIGWEWGRGKKVNTE